MFSNCPAVAASDDSNVSSAVTDAPAVPTRGRSPPPGGWPPRDGSWEFGQLPPPGEHILTNAAGAARGSSAVAASSNTFAGPPMPDRPVPGDTPNAKAPPPPLPSYKPKATTPPPLEPEDEPVHIELPHSNTPPPTAPRPSVGAVDESAGGEVSAIRGNESARDRPYVVMAAVPKAPPLGPVNYHHSRTVEGDKRDPAVCYDEYHHEVYPGQIPRERQKYLVESGDPICRFNR